MRTPDFLILRGSTPVLKMELPVQPEEADVIYLTFRQGSRNVLEYARNGTASPAGTGTLRLSETEPNLLEAEMTQADTLRLDAGECVIQVRLRGEDGAQTFFPVVGRVGEALKQGVI